MSDEDVIGVDDPVEDPYADTTVPPPTPELHPADGVSTKQILLYAQGAVVILVVIVIIVLFLCRPKKKDEKKLEDTNYPSVDQVWEEQKQTRSQVTLRKTQATEESSEC